MIFQDIYKDITSSFAELWQTKERGNSLEIITPFATTSQKFVSLFLTQRDDEFIISDGGWIYEGMYENTFDRGIDCFEKIFLYYAESFKVKEVKNINGSTVFYKKTNNKISVPSMLLDMANFISTVVSLTNVEYSDKEKEVEHNFSKSARNFLEKLRPKKDWADWNFNEYLDQKREVKLSAILRKKDNSLVIMNFITGSNYNYFRTNIGKTNMVFELADKSAENQFVKNKIALIDDTARGYSPHHFSIWLEHLLSKPKSNKIEWTRKKELENI
jgi:hypothetical protein